MIKDWIVDNGLWLLLALAGVVTVLWLWALRARLSLGRPAAVLLSILHLVCGVACVKVFAVIETGGASAGGAMSLFGAVFFMPVLYYAGAKLSGRRMSEVCDIFGIAMIVTLFFARINCLIAGCCKGLPIPGLEPARWPTREAELVFYVVFLARMAPKAARAETRGVVYPVYMIAYGIFRFVTEFFRAGSRGVLHPAHLWAFLAIAAGAGILGEMNSRKNREVGR